MKTSFKVILTFTICALFALSCSRKKDKFVSRNMHALSTEYNILYNGYIALEQGKEALNASYFDNYWDVLPVERMQLSEEIIIPGQSKNENFTRAEEKAIKAIQKHSMNIEGKEKNPQMDEAYMLLGKSRYFDERFIPALEAFNYILYKYAASDKINQAKVWREKTNMRLDNNELAIKNLKRLLRQEDIEGQELADATSTLAQAYINTKVIDTAITHLETASQVTTSHDERGRYRFIQGQLYNKLGLKDSANSVFDKVIELNRKTPRIYMIAAHLEKVKNFDPEHDDRYEVAAFLRELEENRENRPFLDKIYHHTAEFYRNIESDSLAIAYYNKSLRTNSQDSYLKAKNYETLGDMYFDGSVYADAGEYYDSTMSVLPLNSKPYRVIKRKRDNLNDVIFYEGVARVNDSVLNLVHMPDDQRSKYFNNYVDELKRKAEEEKERTEAAERNNGLVTVNNQIGRSAQGGSDQATLFYFYNPTTVSYGKNEFVKIWGNRPLEDNWRLSSKGVSGLNPGNTDIDIVAPVSDDEKFNPDFYISKIPTEEKEIDSISKDRNYAYYQLGLIYKEKFKEYELAKSKFLNLLESNPEERLILPSKYNLYKIYELLGEHDEAEIAKNNIIYTYPDSRYTTILKNPELVSGRDENSPQSLYEALYVQHENQEYAEVVSKSEDYINRFDGDAIVPKFELLKATAKGRLYGYETYKKAINYLAVTYANTPEGKQAKNIESNILPKLAGTEFVESVDSLSVGHKVVFKFNEQKQDEILGFKTTLDTVLKHVKYYKLKSSLDVYDPKTSFVIVHGINSKQVAENFEQLIVKKDKNKIKTPYFVVSSTNYQIIQIHKNLDAYLNLYNN
ncbi:tetratricopeptide repeat protein [Algibacter mikhailovii]|uniref:type IX secretion system periplasmic lipoprotein PorW/SprE n=1 Tax=Algibacter mikhailovii TaxID=425498 RepID=UPI00249522AD|nr:hypothetical protein [Algibacter mikhailovii]